jgi:threonine synthase
LRSKILATSTGSGAPPDPQLDAATTNRACRGRAEFAIAIHIVGTPGNTGGALDLDIAHHGLDVEALVQRDQIAALEAAQQITVSAKI